MGAAEKRDDGNTLIVTLTQEQLRVLVSGAVRDALGKSSAHEIEYLTLEQTAELLQTSTRSVRTWVKESGLPALRAGSEYRFTRAMIVRWLEERSQKPGIHVTRNAERLKRAR